MNLVQENTLSMYGVIIDQISTTPEATIDSMYGFDKIYDDFKTTALLIRAKNELLTASRTASRMIKTSNKEVAVKLAMTLVAFLRAYALEVENTQLIQDMKITKSQLLRKRDTNTADEIQFIISKGQEFLTQLAPYGFQQSQIDALISAQVEFNQIIPAPRVIINSRKKINNEIKKLFIICRFHLERMDSLVDLLQISNNDFYISYFDNRKIINYHGQKLALRGFVYDTNGNPISSVQITIPEMKKDTKTTDKGYFEFKSLSAGIHNLIFDRVDFIGTSRLVGIIKGKRIDLDVTLKKSENSEDVA